MSRDKDIGDVKYFDKEDLRFATPLNVAEYRARRLKCKVIVDLCSGIGVQSASFARTCSQVFGFEIDPRKVEYAKKNFRDVSNIQFLCGDVMSKEVVEKVKEIKPDIIFCDPERLAEEKERNLKSINPDVKKLIEIYSKITLNLCIEMPPRIDVKEFKDLGDCEKEYLVVDNKLNRLDLLFGKLKKSNVSVVDIGGERIEKKKGATVNHVDEISNYIYEVSEGVVKAGLVNELACLVCADILEGSEKNKVILTSEEPEFGLECFAIVYHVVEVCRNKFEINKLLIQNKFGKAVVKYSIDPKDYWKERNMLEKGLRGEKEAVIFRIGNKYIIGKET